MPKTKTPAVPRYESNRQILEAIEAHIVARGGQQKNVAIDAGLEQNYVSMLKKDSRPSLKRVNGLKNAMPDLDDLRLTATILTEMNPDAASQSAILRLVEFMAAPLPFESAVLAITQEVRDNEGAAGLYLPAELPADIRDGIKKLLQEAVQRETRAVMGE